jgi:Prolyl oligopeptidase family
MARRPEYAESSNIEHACKLLLIVGEVDHNVDPAGTRLVQALIGVNKVFDLVAVPTEDHGTGRTIGPIEYCRSRQYDLFVRHLLGAEARGWNQARAGGIPR